VTLITVIEILVTASAVACWFMAARVDVTSVAPSIEELDKVTLLAADLRKLRAWNRYAAAYACAAAVTELIGLLPDQRAKVEEALSLILIAFALGFVGMIIGNVSSAENRQFFVSDLQKGWRYVVGHTLLTTLIFAVPLYAILLIGKLVLSWV
jgi:hypothetical protein